VPDVQGSIAVSSGDVLIDRRFAWARESLATDDPAGAADLCEQVLDMAPTYVPAWFLLGEAREALGQAESAIAAFRKALEYDPADRHGATVRLVRLGAQAATAMPLGYVTSLFDGYAPRFEQALVGALGYRGPDLLLRAVQAHADGRKFTTMLDLGCGTGLAGAAFRPLCDWLTGVDLSPRMVGTARTKGIYDRLVTAEAMSFAAAEIAQGARYDLIVAADVFIYFHELMQLERLAPLLATGGLLAFTVETHDGGGVILRDTLRYAHGAAHVRAALAGAGLGLVSLDSAVARTEKGAPVPGLVVVAQSG
jgi:predicted TPR repeat methyltransferase